MRTILALISLLVLSACSGDPKSFGITGPGVQPVAPVVPSANTPDSSPTPGVTTSGSQYGPSYGPTTGSSGFWGYN